MRISSNSKVISIQTLFAALCMTVLFMASTAHGASVADSPTKEQPVTAGWLGVAVQDVSAPVAKALGLKQPSGSLVDDVITGQPAMQAGIKPGDVIAALDGVEIPDTRSLITAIAKLKPGKVVAVTIWRDGKEQILSATIDKRPAAGQSAGCCCGSAMELSGEGPKLGIIVRALSDAEAQRGGISGGLLVSNVMPGSPAQSAGIQRGDIIVAAGNAPVVKPEEFSAAVSKAKESSGVALLRVFRGGQYYFLAATLADKNAK